MLALASYSLVPRLHCACPAFVFPKCKKRWAVEPGNEATTSQVPTLFLQLFITSTDKKLEIMLCSYHYILVQIQRDQSQSGLPHNNIDLTPSPPAPPFQNFGQYPNIVRIQRDQSQSGLSHNNIEPNIGHSTTSNIGGPSTPKS